MKREMISTLFLIVWTIMVSAQTMDINNKEKTIFQTSSPWKPATDVRSDVAIVYGTAVQDLKSYGIPDDTLRMTFEQRVQSWRDRGYTTHFMTGIAWGDYQDYFTGEWDGKPHFDEAQMTMDGDTLWHGPMSPHIVPSGTFIEYIKEKHVKRVIEAGVDAIHMEEPEFWMQAGYSESFKREWKNYYGFDWRPQHESPENTYLSNKLKYYLYYRALEEVFAYAKEYGKSKGLHVRCYVPTHSLASYSWGGIVSPEAALASLPHVDGYIAQVWTGTARAPVFFNGISKERVFENAFIEYGSMESMTRPTGRKMFFLTDPVEDNSYRDWTDYKKNYQATFVAQLLYTNINNYEVMPWPDRIYEGLYKTCDECDTKEKIPRFYSTQMQVMINSLNDMPLSDNKVSGSSGIGIMMANSMMFQRFPTHAAYDDPSLSSFYGQALPLLKRGVPIEIVHIENTGFPETWKDLKVLVISYSNIKPMKPEYHHHIAEWVKKGGILVYCGEDDDPFQTVMEWWNTDGYDYEKPSIHLFELLGLKAKNPGTGKYNSGKGEVYILRKEPKDFVLTPSNDSTYFAAIKGAYETASKEKLSEKNNLFLARDPYIIAAVMDESVSDEPLVLKGLYIDLFDSELPVLQHKIVRPGEQTYLYDVSTIKDKTRPMVLCGASRIYEEVRKKGIYSFVAKSPINTTNVSRVYIPKKPQKVIINGSSSDFSWDDESRTCLVKFENSSEGVKVQIEY